MNYLNSFLITSTALAAAASSHPQLTVFTPVALSLAVHPLSCAALPAMMQSVRSTSETSQSEQP
ncbi:MAG TPA: hypothetical protein VF450_11195 [Noviherbaspirillum sp.]